jgi:regulator of cell morphogenesis and NO signaling
MTDATVTLARLVVEEPARARVLDRLGLDYCCHGDTSLAAACAEAGLDPGDVLAQLAATVAGDRPDWATLGPVELVDHVLATHHAYLDDELPALNVLADKVLAAHGERHPELRDVHVIVRALRDDLEPHLRKEERVLFPAIRALAVGPVQLPFGSVANPVRMMRFEHESAGALLEQLRAVTSGYAVPDDGCPSYHALYARLEALEHDTHLHVFKENELLFPAALALEQQR